MRIIGVIILVLGAALLFQGLSRRDSLVGHAASAADSVANSVDGGSRQPLHVTYIAGGAALVVVGAFLAFRRSSSS